MKNHPTRVGICPAFIIAMLLLAGYILGEVIGPLIKGLTQ